MADGRARRSPRLPDPVGEELERRSCSTSGLELRKVRVPLGVVAVVYEARPNVTIDCAALTMKSGNAIVLRGSSYAERSNGGARRRRPRGARRGRPARGRGACCWPGGDREDLAELATQDGLVDLMIPRGGEGLKAALKDVATVPVMYAAAGNCHVYVHADADLEMARADRLQRQGPAPGRLQRGRDAARPRSRSPRHFLPGVLADLPRPGSSWSATSGARAAAGDIEVGRRRRRTGTPSTST